MYLVTVVGSDHTLKYQLHYAARLSDPNPIVR